MRDLSTPTNTEKDQNQQDEILVFVDIFLDGEPLHFVANDKDINFFDLDGVVTTYTALAMTRDKIEHTSGMEINTLNASVDNVDQAMALKISQKEFRDRRIIIRGCFRDLLDNVANAWIEFDGRMDKPVIGEKSFDLELAPRLGQGTLNTMFGRLQQLPCDWPFAGTECAYGKSAAALFDSKSAQVVDSGAVGYIVDAARTEADDYWNFGFVTFASDTLTGALRGIKRKIKDFAAAEDKIYFFIALPAAPAAGDVYTITRGCDKTLDSCLNKFDNGINFGGNHTLPALMVRR